MTHTHYFDTERSGLNVLTALVVCGRIKYDAAHTGLMGTQSTINIGWDVCPITETLSPLPPISTPQSLLLPLTDAAFLSLKPPSVRKTG